MTRCTALRAAEEQLEDPPVLDWQREIAVRNGIPPRLIERLVEAFDQAPVDKAATEDWINWLLDVVVEHPLDLTIFVRETALELVFGRAAPIRQSPKPRPSEYWARFKRWSRCGVGDARFSKSRLGFSPSFGDTRVRLNSKQINHLQRSVHADSPYALPLTLVSFVACLGRSPPIKLRKGTRLCFR